MKLRGELIYRDGNLKCIECGAVVFSIQSQTEQFFHDCPFGLGDAIAVFLAFLGVTENRVSFLFKASSCGCRHRQQFLNRLGRRLGIG